MLFHAIKLRTCIKCKIYGWD